MNKNCERIGPICRHCQRLLAEGELRQCTATTPPPRPLDVGDVLSVDERRQLFGEDDPTLIGNRFAELTERFGIPPCGGCADRQEWFNRAHAWLRETAGKIRSLGNDKRPAAGSDPRE